MLHLQFEETQDMIVLDRLNILPIQESVDGWMLTAQSRQRGENRASTVHESGSNMEEDSQVEVLA